jgi:hypothetical protein
VLAVKTPSLLTGGDEQSAPALGGALAAALPDAAGVGLPPPPLQATASSVEPAMAAVDRQMRMGPDPPRS